MKSRFDYLGWDGVEWNGVHYFYWWNWLPKGSRYVGIESMFYDGPHWTFGFWFTNISWSLSCNKWDIDKMWNFKWPLSWQNKENT